jgi:hypothetical protein
VLGSWSFAKKFRIQSDKGIIHIAKIDKVAAGF